MPTPLTILRIDAGPPDAAAAAMPAVVPALVPQTLRRHGGRVLAAGAAAVTAEFDAAAPAVLAAVELVGRRVPVRVGIAVDPAAADALLDAAAVGQVLVCDRVRLLVGPRADLRFDELGGGWEVSRRGAAGPVFPQVLATAVGTAFVGRSAAVAVLADAWRRACAGAGGVVLVGGEAGAGKTRLAAEFARGAHADGAAVLLGSCDGDLALPYQPWVEAVQQVLAARPGWSDDPARVAGLAPLAQLVTGVEPPAPAHRPPRTDPRAERLRLHEAFGRALALAADRWPTLIVLDDLHWAGAQTVELLRHLVRTGLPRGVLVIGAFRDTGDEVPESLATGLADLRRHAGVTRLRLEALDRTAVERFVAEAVGHPLDDDLRALAGELRTGSGGNAFYLGELWRHLVDAGAVAAVGARWVVHDPAGAWVVPDGVREVVTARLLRLTPDARRALEVAAVAGQRVDLEVVARALDAPAQRLDAPLGELVAAGFLEPVEGPTLRYRFTHAIVRDTVEAQTGPIERRGLHLAVADALEEVHALDRRPVLADLARHLVSAAPLAPIDRTVHYAHRAAAQATRSAAYDEAVSHLRAVLALRPPPSRRAQLLLELAVVRLRAGAYAESRAHSREAFTLATATGDAVLAAEAALQFEQGTQVPGLPGGPAVDLLRTAVERTADGPEALRVRLQAALGRALANSGNSGEAGAIVEVALERARRIGDVEAVLVGLQTVITSVHADPRRVIAPAEELEALAAARGDLWNAAYGSACRCRAHIALGELGAAAAALAQLRATNERGRFAVFESLSLDIEAVLAVAAGDLAGAEALAARSVAVTADGLDAFGPGVHGVQMFAIRRAQGRLAEVAPVLRLLDGAAAQPPVWRPGLAALSAELGLLDEAAALLTDLATDGFGAVPRDALWPACLAYLAETCVSVRDRECAARLVGELERYTGTALTAAFTMSFGPADRLLGAVNELCGRPAAADRAFAAALALAERSGSPLWTAEVLFEHAAVLAGRGDDSTAAALRRRAEHLADSIGMGWRRRTGRPAVPPAAEALPGGLSAREAEVLRWVSAGLSNQEISARLHISRNTVANHVRAILRKTACANRTQAAAYAHRAGISER
ncbi:helix-turn-helix transcriptional regulator [Pseudonocardia lacus]|uniref:helix-turn-helix transcriptional regulator n=1 Tax=Pseudonocardia lacus TaxID=2835865 RepID=UPI001BDC7A18|nr:LuxR family transcriptional regulator [Pseudonocardia lacus]